MTISKEDLKPIIDKLQEMSEAQVEQRVLLHTLKESTDMHHREETKQIIEVKKDVEVLEKESAKVKGALGVLSVLLSIVAVWKALF